jgi:hypothetical protein
MMVDENNYKSETGINGNEIILKQNGIDGDLITTRSTNDALKPSRNPQFRAMLTEGEPLRGSIGIHKVRTGNRRRRRHLRDADHRGALDPAGIPVPSRSQLSRSLGFVRRSTAHYRAASKTVAAAI